MTAPKGQPTAARGSGGGRTSRISPVMEWIIAVLVITIVLGAIIYFGRDIRSSTGGHSGAPVDAPAEVVVDLAPALAG